MEIILLLIMAVLPPAAFLVYILYMDRLEPEPIGFITKIMLIGGIAVIPAALIETWLYDLAIFKPEGLAGAALKSFIAIAPIEEICKLAVVLLAAWKSKNFNEENDGIVYAGSAALGFAMFENIFYVMDKGLGTGLLRAVSAIPLHTFTGIMMGYFIGKAKFTPAGPAAALMIITGLAAAVLVHGFYDMFALSGTALAAALLPLVIGIIIACLLLLKKGRAMSISRWKDNATEPAPSAPAVESKSEAIEEIRPEIPAGKAEVPSLRKSFSIKALISRAVFMVCGGFWALLIIGMAESDPGEIPKLIGGGIIITIVPIAIAVLLEVSHRRDVRGR
jgi:protease PrsW